MNKFDLHKRRKELNLTLEDIGSHVGVSKSTVKKWETGFIENMKRDKIALLADILQVSPLIIMGYDEENNGKSVIYSKIQNIKQISTKRFPTLGEIACGKPIMAEQEYETYIEASSNINADFCLIAKGDSMINARIFDGDVVFIKEQPIVENGEIAAVIIDNEATLKRVYIKTDRIILRPENPVYDDIIYEKEEMNNVRILGKAVAFTSYVK